MRVNKSIYLLVFFLPFIVTVLAFFLFFAPNTNASDHYVDKNAKGLNNGTSWNNAWQSFSAISWGQIKPGDVIYISGGTDSTIYYERLHIQASGTAANPITIRNSYDSGHDGIVIIDGNNYTNNSGGLLIGASSSLNPDYVYVKGLEIRRFGTSPAVQIYYACEVITLDSLLIYDNRDRAIRIAGSDSNPTVTGHPDSITVKNSYITSRQDEPTQQTDLLYAQDAANIFIHNNFMRMNQVHPENTQHVDILQGHRTRGWKIWNNYMIADSSSKTQVVILGAWDLEFDEVTDSVIIYNNFLFDTGIWEYSGYATVLYLRYYERSGSLPPPTVILHNTVISYGPNYYNTKMEYLPHYAANNIFVQYGDGVSGERGFLNLFHNSSGDTLFVDEVLDNNLYWRGWTNDANWGMGNGYYSGNGNTTRSAIPNWTTFKRTYGGNGYKGNPKFEYDFSNFRNADILSYTMEDWRNGLIPAISGTLTSNSPARNQGLNLQSMVEGMGFDWKDINGNPRNSTPDIGAYQD